MLKWRTLITYSMLAVSRPDLLVQLLKNTENNKIYQEWSRTHMSKKMTYFGVPS